MNELLDELNESLKTSNELKALQEANAKKQEELNFDDFFKENGAQSEALSEGEAESASKSVNEALSGTETLSEVESVNEALSEAEPLKKSEPLKESLNELSQSKEQGLEKQRGFSLYDYYLLNKAGLGGLVQNANNEDLRLKIKSLSGEKEYAQIKDINHALNNLNSIIANSNQTSGTWNNLARGISNLTSHFISADKENQERINDQAGLFGNYLNAVSLRSGGTANEREKIRQAINFGNLDSKETRAKALKIYDDLMQRQQIALNTLKSKGYNQNMIFHDENELNAFYKNQKIYEYLKSGKSFNEKEFKSLRYDKALNEDKRLRSLRRENE